VICFNGEDESWSGVGNKEDCFSETECSNQPLCKYHSDARILNPETPFFKKIVC
jgi:hypothetical protein